MRKMVKTGAVSQATEINQRVARPPVWWRTTALASTALIRSISDASGARKRAAMRRKCDRDARQCFRLKSLKTEKSVCPDFTVSYTPRPPLSSSVANSLRWGGVRISCTLRR